MHSPISINCVYTDRQSFLEYYLMFKRIIAITFTALSFTGAIQSITAAQAEVYKSTDDAGNVVFSDQKPSENARPETTENTVNYFSSPTPSTTRSNAQVSSASKSSTKPSPTKLSKLSAEEETTNIPILTEEQCQEQYGRSCDEIINWLEYAKQDCTDDSRCDNPDFLDRKYRPRSNEEMRKIALRSAARNNNHEEKIALFLTKKYTNFCENQAALLCRNKLDRNCEAKIEFYCEDKRSLKDVFQKYDNLNAIERQAIIDKAKALALANGDDVLDYDKLVTSLIEILISQATMGF